MRYHFINLVAYSVAVAALLSIFMRDRTRTRLRFAAWLAFAMVGSAVVVAWLMLLGD